MAKDNIIKRTIDRAIDRYYPELRNTILAPTSSLGLPYGAPVTSQSITSSLQLSAVYRCIEVVSDAIASQSWEVLEYAKKDGFVKNEFHDLTMMLNLSPCPSMSRYAMMKAFVSKVMLDGVGYLVIKRDTRGDAIQLDLVNKTVKKFIREDGTIYFEVGIDADMRRVEGDDMIEVLNYSYDGLVGVSTIYHACNTLGLSHAAEGMAKGFFANGANASVVISVEGRLQKGQAQEIKNSFRDALQPDPVTGVGGGIAVVEGGLKVQPLTVNPRDAQMLETRQFNVIDICRFFGVHPSKVFDSSNLTYSNIESFQLGFLTDTISPWDNKIENEFNRKLLRPSQRKLTKLNLDITELMRANLDTKANYISKMFAVGGYTVNEVRKELGHPMFEDKAADTPLVQINLQKIDDFGKMKAPLVDKAAKVPQNNNDNGKGDKDN